MNPLKVGLLTAALLSSCNAAAQSQNVKTLQNELKTWQPIDINQQKDLITITLNENQVTSSIYHAVISDGICFGIWLHSTPDGFLKSVKEIRVLNKHSYKGYALTAPLTACNEMGSAKNENDGKVLLFSHSRLFTNTDS
ncbi:hypothetical protein [Rahnella aceris]|uniref:hypothetical protein n=1 Tax=Rahnella sp. (strain Y9602) TaxID=2703885 RepID=UPI00366440F7